MERCRQCDAELEPGHRFCPGCGAPVEGGAVDGDRASPPAPHADADSISPWRRGPRVVLAFLAIALALGLVFVLAVIYFIRHTTIVTTTKNGERIEAPNSVVTTSNDPAKLAKTLGLNHYPGSIGIKGTQMAMANSILVSLTFRTPDPPRRVIDFYHVRYPDATVKHLDHTWTLIEVELRETLTIKASPAAGATEITVSDIRH